MISIKSIHFTSLFVYRYSKLLESKLFRLQSIRLFLFISFGQSEKIGKTVATFHFCYRKIRSILCRSIRAIFVDFSHSTYQKFSLFTCITVSFWMKRSITKYIIIIKLLYIHLRQFGYSNDEFLWWWVLKRKIFGQNKHTRRNLLYFMNTMKKSNFQSEFSTWKILRIVPIPFFPIENHSFIQKSCFLGPTNESKNGRQRY